MENYVSTDDNLRHQAREIAKARRNFRIHAIITVLLCFFFVLVYLLTDRGGFFWPIFSIAGVGIGLLAHWLAFFRIVHGKTLEEETEIEYQRLKKKSNKNIVME